METALKILLSVLLSIGGLLLVGLVYEQYSRWQMEKRLKGKGTFAQVGKYKLHYTKIGQGDCTVVFQSGLGSDGSIWREVLQEIAKNAVTISYDKSRLFYSENGDTTKSNASISNELYALLEQTNCPKPYVLVGHSMAGIYLRKFAEDHLAGMVSAWKN